MSKLCDITPYLFACDRLQDLIRWCRDPIVAETQNGNKEFAAAVRRAEIAFKSVEIKCGWTYVTGLIAPRNR